MSQTPLIQAPSGATAAVPSNANPANAPEKTVRRRIPLGLPTLKLAVPEIPGHVLYWFRGSDQRMQQAYDAGYSHVKRGDVITNHAGLANSYESDGNSDLGSNVSVGEGDGTRLYLMKLPRELWLEDEVAIEEKHDAIAAQLRGDKGIPQPGDDPSKRYSRGESRNLFTPRRP